jgi:hypothetical protein
MPKSGKTHLLPWQNLEFFWWARQDLNLGPTDYESAALTAELRAPPTSQDTTRERLRAAIQLIAASLLVI